jgi:p-hydroxybenzoate 3-monooxygenase
LRKIFLSIHNTQVAIIGGGPSGLLLSHILHLNGIESIIVERQSKSHVIGRIRAGVLEAGTVQLLRDVGLGKRMDKEGIPHDGTSIAWEGKPSLFIDVKKYTGKSFMAYGQTSITEDLFKQREIDNGHIFCEASEVKISDVEKTHPKVTFLHNGKKKTLICDYIAGCDGFHGVSRHAIPQNHQRSFQRNYPFGWLGIMAEVPPYKDVLYAYHSDGFALASQRNPMLSRFYIQVDINDKVEDWSDDRFWEALIKRLPADVTKHIKTGPSIEKSIAPLRSFVSEPMQYHKLFLAGDSAHVVPPTGAKGLNLAVSDIYYLSRAIIEAYKNKNYSHLENYSKTALSRVWGAINLSWRLTKMLHIFPGEDPFDAQIRQSDYDLLLKSEELQQALAVQYIGLPYNL